MNRLWRTRDGERGAIMVLAAGSIVMAVICAALAIDLGGVAEEARRNQKVADLAALDAARRLPATTAVLTAAAQSAATRNGFTLTATDTVDAVEGIESAGGTCTAAAGAGTVCVRVSSIYREKLPFVTTRSNVVTRTALAGNNGSIAEFGLGSTLANLDTQKSALDSVIGNNLGISMSAVSYSGLAGANVTLSALQTQLAALGYSVGTPTTLMNANIKVKDLLTATAAALTAQPNTTAAAEVNKIPIINIAGTLTMQLGKLINLATPSSTSALSTTVNAFQLVSGSAQLQNGTSFVTVPGINVTVPGLTGLTVGLKVISPAQIAQGPVGTTANNAQIVLQLKFNLSVLGVGLVAVTLNEANATAVATLTAIRCSSSPGVTISAATSAITTTGTIGVPLGTLTVNGSAVGTAANSNDFDYTTEFVPPRGTGTYWATGAAEMGLDNTVTVSGSGLTAVTAPLVQPVLDLTLPLLNTALSTALKPVLQALGANLAEADVSAMEIFPPPPACSRPGLLG
ncbi:MAG TPA: pilus assembly protein TadG-related protein [Nonomuraea sp.]|nr:pilus assembly protein TadG-related protein [Nonomuraea sp.]